MTPEALPLLAAALAAVAFLYSSVGHAGASGYLAVLALAGLAPAEIRPAALTLNLVVASLTAWQFHRAGHFSGRVCWPIALPAVPCAFLGGCLELPREAFEFLLGLVLAAAALRFLLPAAAEAEGRPPARLAALAAGLVLGFLAGLAGVGGGIFLTPLLILLGWAKTKTAAAVSAVFILLNSLAGLAGFLAAGGAAPLPALPLAAAVATGGAAGSWLGSRRFSAGLVRKLLAAVLLVAAAKMLFG